MSCPPEYWIWMQRTLGAGVNADSILMYFGNPQKLYESGKGQWISSGVIGTAAAKKLTSYSPSQSYDIIKTCRENGWSIITFDDERYPESLKEIYCPPVVLYVWGDASVLREKVLISMVGTRNASEYGLSVAESLSYSLGEAGAVVVSGGALGIDSEVQGDYSEILIEKGEKLLLCTDGLTNHVSEDEIIRCVNTGEIFDCAHRLISLANSSGGTDNITAVVIAG